MAFRSFIHFVKQYLRNETAPPLVWNLHRHGDLTVEHGKFKRRDRRVGFLNLFSDLFLVASLGLFTQETDLGEGEKWGSYIAFFVAIWSIWYSQVIFDVRYGGKDGIGFFFNFLQLCVFGMLAAIAGVFHVGYGFSSYEDPRLSTSIPQWISPVNPIIDTPAAVKRGLKVACGVYAISRFLLVFQYLIVLHQTTKAGRSLRPPLIAMAGLVVSGCLFFAAMAVTWHSFGDTETAAILRTIFWGLAWVIEYTTSTLSATSSDAVLLEQEYWTERFAALTLVVLGEGVLGLFESYRTAFIGPLGGYTPATIGIVVAAVALYRLLYHLYFHDFAHHLRGGTGHHLAWGLLHLPMSLSLLLLTQCVVRNIRSINIWYALDPWSRCLGQLDAAVANLTTANPNATVSEYTTLMLDSDAGLCLQRYASRLGTDWAAQVDLYATLASDNVVAFSNLVQASAYNLLLRLFSASKFEPSREVYNLLNEYIDSAQLRENLQEDAFDNLVQILYISSQPALTVMGGYLVCLAGLKILQPNHNKAWTRIAIAGRLVVGFILLLSTLLNIGVTSYSQQSPMDNLLDNNWLVPVLAASAFVATVFDMAGFVRKRGSSKQGTHSPSIQPSLVSPNGSHHDEKRHSP